MAAKIERARKRLRKRGKKGFRGWPLATVALYGPDDSTATKLTVGIVPAEDAEATDLPTLVVEGADRHPRRHPGDGRSAGVHHRGRSEVGCHDRPDYRLPHEEGIDYEGATCPACPFWAGRDRWTGERLH
jgi:hypothetical protein